VAPDAPWASRTHNPHLDPGLTWSDLEWLESLTALPVVVKGILRADDAVRVVDGGIRRGTDVAKALCRGADAVLIGRPYVWGLAV